jgi:predicted DNA-binding WGR domain protein
MDITSSSSSNNDSIQLQRQRVSVAGKPRELKCLWSIPVPTQTIFKDKRKKMSLKRIYLENITNGHYKFYEMIDNGDGSFIAKYGKINTAGSSEVYPENMWSKKLSEKLNKGYVIVEEVNFKKSDVNATQNDINTMLAKLKVLSRTIEEVLDVKYNKTLDTQLKTVEKISKRLKDDGLILSTDLKYCNRLFKKVINLRKKLIP